MNNILTFVVILFQMILGVKPTSSVSMLDLFNIYTFLAKKSGANAQRLSANLFPFVAELFVIIVFMSSNKITKSIDRKITIFNGLAFTVDSLKELADLLRSGDTYQSDQTNTINFLYARVILDLRRVLKFDPLQKLYPNSPSPSNQELNEIIDLYKKSSGKDIKVQRPNFKTSFEDLTDLGSVDDALNTMNNTLTQDEDDSDDESDSPLSPEAEVQSINIDLQEIKLDRNKYGRQNDDIEKAINEALAKDDIEFKQNVLTRARKSRANLFNTAKKRREAKKKK